MSQFIATLPPIVVCLLVCCSKILEISIQSLKTVMMVKGQRFKAALLGFVECIVWGLVISSVITTLGDNILLLLFYCLGYATGLYLGSTLEGKIALGTSSVELIVNRKNAEKVKSYLRERDKGFTVFEGEGAKEKVYKIRTVLPRKEAKKIIKEVCALCDNQVFEITTEVSKYTGGYGVQSNTK